MTEYRSEVLLDGLAFPEGPRWHDDRLYFSDMHAGVIRTVEPSGTSETLVAVPGEPSGLGWLPENRGGDLLVVSMQHLSVMRLRDDALEVHADLGALARTRCNDMVVDADGRAYVGSFGFDLYSGEEPAATALALVQPDGTVSEAAGDLLFPNGTVITPDGNTLIVAETFAARLTAFDVAADGTLSNRRAWAQLDGHLPDGICLDADDAVWVAAPTSGAVLRVREGGEITDTVKPSEGHAPYACMLGGPDGRTLFLCTSTAMLPADTLEQRGGCIEVLDVDAPHAGRP